jgi:hypothetical protein
LHLSQLKKPSVKKVAKKLPISSAKSKKQPSLTAGKKSRIPVKNKSNQQSSITKKKVSGQTIFGFED